MYLEFASDLLLKLWAHFRTFITSQQWLAVQKMQDNQLKIDNLQLIAIMLWTSMGLWPRPRIGEQIRERPIAGQGVAQVHLREVAFEHSERGINYFRKVLNSRIIRILTTSPVNIIKSCPVLRVIDQSVNPRQVLLPEAKGWEQWWLSRVDNPIYHPQHRTLLFILHWKSIVHSPCLSLYFRLICKTRSVEHELVQGFSNNSLPCKQMTTFSPLLFVSAQLVNVPLFLQNEFTAK